MEGRNIWAHFDDMTWPVAGDALDDLEWRLRYGAVPDRPDALSAASVIAAYRHLTTCTERNRAHIVRCLKKHTKTKTGNTE